MGKACGGAPSSSVAESIRDRAAGLPLLVEDLLSIEESVVPGSPGLVVRAAGGKITVLGGDAGLLSGPVSYETEVTMTGGSTFVEKGTLVIGDRRMSIDNVGEGVLEPSAQAGVMQGSRALARPGPVARWHDPRPPRDIIHARTGDWRSGENQVLRLFITH